MMNDTWNIERRTSALKQTWDSFYKSPEYSIQRRTIRADIGSLTDGAGRSKLENVLI